MLASIKYCPTTISRLAIADLSDRPLVTRWCPVPVGADTYPLAA
jgi:hypothetical protein